MRTKIKIFALFLAIFYMIMLFDTNSLIKNVKDNMELKADKVESPTDLVWMYNPYRKSYEQEKALIADSFVLRLFTVHNFKNGHIWVIYSNKVKNDNDKVLYGSSMILSHWEIYKENGEWHISAIYESP